MLICEIAGSMPGEIDQVNLIADLTEEEYFEFAGMCSRACCAEVHRQ